MSKDNTLNDFITALNNQVDNLPIDKKIMDKVEDIECNLGTHLTNVKEVVKEEKKKVDKKIVKEKKEINKDIIRRLNDIEEQIRVTQRSLNHLSKKITKIRKEVEKRK